jgi:hypothetical protein
MQFRVQDIAHTGIRNVAIFASISESQRCSLTSGTCSSR